jgi:hypothetical protein
MLQRRNCAKVGEKSDMAVMLLLRQDMVLGTADWSSSTVARWRKSRHKFRVSYLNKSFWAVLWICIGFNADPETAFYLHQGAKPMRIRILVRLSRHKRLNLYTKIYLKKVIGQRHTSKGTGTKTFLKGRKSGLFVNFVLFPCSRIRIPIRIRIRIQDSYMNADPDQQHCFLDFNSNGKGMPR